jgi:hypothetical protein
MMKERGQGKWTHLPSAYPDPCASVFANQQLLERPTAGWAAIVATVSYELESPERRSTENLQLAADAQLTNQGAVSLDIGRGKVGKDPFATSNHREKPTTGVMVVLVLTQVLGKLVDARGKQRNLHLWRAGVTLTSGVAEDNVLLDVCLKRHGLENLLYQPLRGSLAQNHSKVNLNSIAMNPVPPGAQHASILI